MMVKVKDRIVLHLLEDVMTGRGWVRVRDTLNFTGTTYLFIYLLDGYAQFGNLEREAQNHS